MMVFPKRAFFMVIGLVLVLVVSACGSTTSTGSTQNTPTAAATPTTASTFTLQTAQATVNGKATTILADPQGRTLYYFTPDTATKVACTGGCAKVWPPLLFTGSGTPLGDASLSGTLSVLNGANGNQVEYNGHLLYIYARDTAPDQTNGAGLFGKWFVCTPSLAAA